MADQKSFIAITGGRAYGNYHHVKRVLDEERPGVVVQGECPYGGADRLAKRWCGENGVPCIGVEALWDYYGNSAGPMRNGWMFDLLPIYKLIAFPGDRGTANAVKQAYAREILVRDERAAQGTEAQRAETVQLGSVHDGPVAESDAPPCPENPCPTYPLYDALAEDDDILDETTPSNSQDKSHDPTR